MTIASNSSWHLRYKKTLYFALNTAKAAFTRNLAVELPQTIPGSKVMLVNPGGMKIDLFTDGRDMSTYMEPDEVARIIWDEAQGQIKLYHEVNILRNDDGSPFVSYGPKTPETLNK